MIKGRQKNRGDCRNNKKNDREIEHKEKKIIDTLVDYINLLQDFGLPQIRQLNVLLQLITDQM